jgi:hypothetical protein
MLTRGSCTPSSRALSTLVTALCLITCGAAVQSPDQLDEVLERVSQRVQDYYERAQSIMCQETVRWQPVRSDLTPEGFGRSLEYDLRVSWDSAGEDGTAPEAVVLRELRKVNGRPARPKDEPGCYEPREVSPEPLAMLLPRHRNEYAFRWAGLGKVKDRPAIMIDYKDLTTGPIEATWKGDCASFSLPGRTKGRVWIDRVTHEVLRLDESLTSGFEYRLPPEHWGLGRIQTWVFERVDSSIRYRPVLFHDPEETVLLPESIESIQITRGAQGVHKTQVYSQYRRFLTSGRIVK